MKFPTFILLLISIVSCNSEKTNFAQSEMFELSAPMVNVDSVFFKNNSRVNVEFELNGSEILLSENGLNEKEISENDLMYSESKSLIFKSRHPDYKESAPINIDIFKLNQLIQIDEILLAFEPNEQYPGIGVEGLKDGIKAELNYLDEQWMGFKENAIQMNVSFQDSSLIEECIISLLKDQNSWIFEAEVAKIKSQNQVIGEWINEKHSMNSKTEYSFIRIPIEQDYYSEFELILQPVKSMPVEHPGGGQPAWLFIDEILFN